MYPVPENFLNGYVKISQVVAGDPDPWNNAPDNYKFSYTHTVRFRLTHNPVVIKLLITSVKEDMFLSLFVCLFVC